MSSALLLFCLLSVTDEWVFTPLQSNVMLSCHVYHWLWIRFHSTSVHFESLLVLFHFSLCCLQSQWGGRVEGEVDVASYHLINFSAVFLDASTRSLCLSLSLDHITSFVRPKETFYCCHVNPWAQMCCSHGEDAVMEDACALLSRRHDNETCDLGRESRDSVLGFCRLF